MSEISAAFILDYIGRNLDSIYSHHINLYRQFKDKLTTLSNLSEKVKLFPHHGSGIPFVNSIVLIFNRKITNDDLQICELSGITARKYYKPLKDLPISTLLYDRILCLPCHLEVDENTLDRYIELIKLLIK